MVGAATVVRMSDGKLVRRQMAKSQEWQAISWDMFDLVPDVKQPTWLMGNAMAKLKLFVAVDDPKDPDGEPIPVSDDKAGVPPEIAARAIAELDRLKGPVGGQGEILRALNMNLEVAAEGYIVGTSARPEEVDASTGKVKTPARAEAWTVRSVSEVEPKRTNLADGKVSTATVKDDPLDRKGTPLDPDLDNLIRFWQRHPRWANRADCAMRALLDDCETLLILKRQLRAEAKSHVPAGALFVDSNIKWVPMDPTVQAGEDPASNPIVTMLVDALTAPIEDESHPASQAPLVGLIPLNGPQDDITKKVMHMSFARSSEATLDSRIEKRVQSIARGLNLPMEKSLGHQQTTFANADQVNEDEWDDHYQPRAVLICDILTVGFLRPQLADPGLPAESGDDPEQLPVEVEPPPTPVPQEWVDRLFVWYDETAVVRQPDRGANADKGRELGIISDASWRKAKGFGEDDAPDVTERLINLAFSKGQLGPEVTLALLELTGQQIDVQPLPGAPAAQRGRPIEVLLAHRSGIRAALTAAAGRSQVGRQLVDIDRDLRSRLIVRASDAMTRALERAGNVIRSRAPETRTLTRTVPAHLVAATLGPALVAAAGVDVDEILAEAFDVMEPQFMAWGAAAQADALEIASRISSGFTLDERDAFQLRQAADLSEAWGWLRDALTSLAHARLFDPAPIVTVGEFDPTLTVPAGLIRQSLVRAGGLNGVQTSGAGDAWLSLADGGRRPAGQIATGELLRSAMADHGVDVGGYVWVYGPALRRTPFQPHLDLDGVPFDNFDDAVLAVTDEGAWIGQDFYMPGDHDGCVCDFEPVLSGSGPGDVGSTTDGEGD